MLLCRRVPAFPPSSGGRSTCILDLAFKVAYCFCCAGGCQQLQPPVGDGVRALTITGFSNVPAAAAAQEGANSPILQWEKEYVVGEGFPPNAQLNDTVSAISYFQ